MTIRLALGPLQLQQPQQQLLLQLQLAVQPRLLHLLLGIRLFYRICCSDVRLLALFALSSVFVMLLRMLLSVFPTCGWGALFSAAAWFCWFFLLLQKVSEEVLCVMCEPRFGTGELENKGKPILCPQLCERW